MNNISSKKNSEDDEYFLDNVLKQKMWHEKIKKYFQKKVEDSSIYVKDGLLNRLAVPLSFEELYMFLYYRPTQICRKLCGRLDLKALLRSFHTVVERHETLRTVFHEKNDSISRHIVDSSWFNVRQIDLGDTNTSDYMKMVFDQAKIDSELVASFQKPLFAATLIQFAEEDHVLLLTGHHIVFDAWGWGVLTKELFILYNAYTLKKSCPLSSLPMQYRDFVYQQQLWYQGEEYRKIERYWFEKLSGLPLSLKIPTDRPRSEVTSFIYGCIEFDFPQELKEAIFVLICDQKTTLFAVALSIVSVFLAHYSSQNDIVIAYVKSGRGQPEYDNIIGNFADLMLFRTHVNFQLTFREHLSQVKEKIFKDYGNIKISLLLLEKIFRQHFGNEKFNFSQVLININPGAIDNMELSSINIVDMDRSLADINYINKRFPLDIYGFEFGFTFHKNGISLVYNSELYDAAMMESVVESFKKLFRLAVDKPESPISEFTYVR